MGSTSAKQMRVPSEIFICMRARLMRGDPFIKCIWPRLFLLLRRPPQTTHDVISIQYTRVVYISYSVYERRQGQEEGAAHHIQQIRFGK
jgi:hypothetical protein